MKKILSIIVPSYNMEKYLPKCLGSLIVAPELMEKLEVLVVNDGSKDRTSEIAHEFEAKWPQTFKVIDKENGHYGSCVNAGLAVASGAYVRLIDADDYDNGEAFALFLHFLSECAASSVDLVVNNFCHVDVEGRIVKHFTFDFLGNGIRKLSSLTGEELSRVILHSITYRAEIFRRIEYHQTEGCMYTDTEWSTLPMVAVKTVRHFPMCLHCYLLGRDGQSMAEEIYAKNYQTVADIHLRVVSDIPQMAKKAGCDELCQKVMFDRLEVMVTQIYRKGLVGFKSCAANIDLTAFDKTLQRDAEWLYRRMGELNFSRHIPIRLIHSWRHDSRLLFAAKRGLCKLFLSLGSPIMALRRS